MLPIFEFRGSNCIPFISCQPCPTVKCFCCFLDRSCSGWAGCCQFSGNVLQDVFDSPQMLLNVVNSPKMPQFSSQRLHLNQISTKRLKTFIEPQPADALLQIVEGWQHCQYKLQIPPNSTGKVINSHSNISLLRISKIQNYNSESLNIFPDIACFVASSSMF